MKKQSIEMCYSAVRVKKHVVLREMLSFGLEEFIVAIILHSLHDLSFIAFVRLIVSTLLLA